MTHAHPAAVGLSPALPPRQGLYDPAREHDAGLTLEYAMAWGEQEAAEDIWSTKAASWRKGKASEKQIAWLATRRIPVPEGLTKNDASALIDIYDASRELDKHLR